MTLQKLYDQSLKNSSIRDHLPFMKFLSNSVYVRDILELGSAAGDSTVAFLTSQPKELISIDVESSELEQKIDKEDRGAWKYLMRSPLDPDLNFHADLLFTNGYNPEKYVKNIRKWILLYACGELEFENWCEVYHYNGLTVLERKVAK